MSWTTVRSRFVRLIGTLWLIVSATFVCAYALPGDPARMILGQRATPASIAAFRQSAGLDDSIAVQYARFVGRALRLELGDSLVQRRPVSACCASAVRKRSPSSSSRRCCSRRSE